MSNDYIRKQDAKDALQEKVFHNLTDEFYGAMQVLDEQEPVDVVQVVHAHWIRHENADIIYRYYVPCFECSQCGAWKEDDSDFCPDCGARMD